VSRIVWKIKSNTSLLKCRISEKKKLQRITTATLTKLFDISIVAKRTNAETHKNNPANTIAKIAPPDGAVISMAEENADEYESGSKNQWD
jgi:hypothetical protein